DEPARALFGLLLVLPLVYPPAQTIGALEDADRLRFGLSDVHASEARVVQRVVGHEDERLGRDVRRQRHLTALPETRQVMAPRLLQSLEEQVGTAEQQDLRRRRVALGERREVLIDDRLEQARDDLVDRHAGLDQRVRVGFGE